MKSIFQNPLKLAGTVIVLTIAMFWVVAELCYWDLGLHAAHANTHVASDPLVLKGHEVYYEAGCQSCHTQNIRPFRGELLRYSDPDKFGRDFNLNEQDMTFFTPAVVGSRRIGPDLAAVASKFIGEQGRQSLVTLLSSKDSKTARSAFHNYSNLFVGEDAGQSMDSLRMSWKIRWLMNAGLPISDAYQRGVFDRLDGSTKGDALVEYLLFLGKRNMAYEGQFYK